MKEKAMQVGKSFWLRNIPLSKHPFNTSYKNHDKNGKKPVVCLKETSPVQVILGRKTL
jgi:hypothetical protein